MYECAIMCLRCRMGLYLTWAIFAVYIQTPPEKCLERLKERGRKEEQAITLVCINFNTVDILSQNVIIN